MEKDAAQIMEEVSLLGRLQQDVDVIVAQKTNTEMFAIGMFIFSFDFFPLIKKWKIALSGFDALSGFTSFY